MTLTLNKYINIEIGRINVRKRLIPLFFITIHVFSGSAYAIQVIFLLTSLRFPRS